MTEDVIKMIEEYDRISAKAHKLRRMEITEAAVDAVSASPFAIDHAHVEPCSKQPSAAEIVAVLSVRYKEPEKTVVEWLEEYFSW